MKNFNNPTYKRTATTVSLIRYHLVFCPKYRRKIFLIPGVEEAFKKHVTERCNELGVDILAMECHIDHVHMFVDAPPQLSIPEIVRNIKGCTSHTLRDLRSCQERAVCGQSLILSVQQGASARQPYRHMLKHKKHADKEV